MGLRQRLRPTSWRSGDLSAVTLVKVEALRAAGGSETMKRRDFLKTGLTGQVAVTAQY
jgi:hypothetical protein